MISRVEKILEYSLQKFFEDYIAFMTTHKQTISDYYTQDINYPKTAFDTLFDLKNRSSIILEKISSSRDSLVNFSDFEVVDNIETVIHSLEIIENYSRWLRSSLFKGRFKQNTEVDIILKQNQTLEDFSGEIGYSNQDSGAIDIALRNNLKETDFSLEGGIVFKFNYLSQSKLILSSVVDNLSGENVLGKDVYKKITFNVDDLTLLSPQDTFYQTCFILISLLKKDNPEFPNMGFDKSTLSNKNVINNMIPSFIRQLNDIVSKDDSIANFSVTNIIVEKDILRIEVTFRSWLNNEVKQLTNGN